MIYPAFNSGGPNSGKYGTWDQCNAYCHTSYPGAMMLCINNAAENEWISSQMLYTGYNGWIGYTDMPPYGGGKGTKQYGWVTGCSSTYTNWARGQPDNEGNNEDYAGVYPNNALWLDMSPQIQWICGCEYTPALTTTPSTRPSTAPSFRPSTVPTSRPSTAPSSGSTSSPTATPSFEPSEGDISE